MNLEEYKKDYFDGEEVVITFRGVTYDPMFKDSSFTLMTPDGLFSGVGHEGIINIEKTGKSAGDLQEYSRHFKSSR